MNKHTVKTQPAAPKPIVLAKPLTELEVALLQFRADGLCEKEIAARRQVSKSTVKNEFSTIRAKMNVDSTISAVVTAMRVGLIH